MHILPHCMSDRCVEHPVLVSWNFKVHKLTLESPGVVSAVGSANNHPHDAQKLGVPAQAPPQEQADEKSSSRHKKVIDSSLTLSYEIMEKGSGIDAHECQQRAEVQELHAALKAESQGSDQSNDGDEEHIVTRNLPFGFDGAKKTAWNGIASAHSIEKTGGSKLRARSRSDGGDQQCDVDQ